MTISVRRRTISKSNLLAIASPRCAISRATAASPRHMWIIDMLTYLDVPLAAWRDELRAHNFPEHVYHHFTVMAQLHAESRYDRLTHDVDALLGRPATSVRTYVAKHPELWRAQPDTVLPKESG